MSRDTMPAFVCRACRETGSSADVALDLGEQPNSQHFPPAATAGPDPAYPLALWVCERCGLAQLVSDTTPDEEAAAVEPEALRDQARDAVQRVRAWLPALGRVREFASPHGGSWLPALAAVGAFEATEGTADVVVDSFGVMHDADQRVAFAQRAAALADDGVLLLNVQHLGGIVRQGQWNALRHGHFAYYTLASLQRLLAGAGLVARHVELFDLYGGTALVVATRGGDPDASIAAMLADEDRAELSRVCGVASLQDAVTRESGALRDYLAAARAEGRRVVGYPAASRTVVVATAAGLDAGLLPAVYDASPAKAGARIPSPGTGAIPIRPASELPAADVDEVLLFLPDLAPELRRRYPELASRLVSYDPTTGVIGGPTRHVETFEGSIAWQARLHDVVPGGAHTYARGSDQYPEFAPVICARGRGGRTWDVDGNCFVEFGIGLRAVTLGHADPRVDAAVARAVRDGVNFSRPTRLEALAAEEFLSALGHHDRIKFAKNGSDVTTAAIKLARAATGRTGVLAGDQSFFSVDDWWMGHTPMDAGIPQQAHAAVRRFDYGDLEQLRVLFDADPDVACVIMQPESAIETPAPGYLEAVRDLAHERGAVLIFDEIITGYRWHRGGVQTLRGVVPDLACWAKGIGNGYAISALTGRAELMDLGGLNTDARRPFLLSTTYGAESVGLAALRAVMRVYDAEDPVAVMRERGRQLADGVAEVSTAAGLSDVVGTAGYPGCLMFWTKDGDGNPSQGMRTVFLQGLLDHGVLAQSFVTCAAHTPQDIEHTIWAVEQSLPDYARALNDGWERVLSGRPVAPSNRAYAAPRRR